MDLIKYFVLSIWAIVGFLVWIPMLIRASMVFTFQACANGLTGQSVRGLGHPVRFAATFYARTFRDISNALSEDAEGHMEPPPKVPWDRLAAELLWATLCWAMLLLSIGSATGLLFRLPIIAKTAFAVGSTDQSDADQFAPVPQDSAATPEEKVHSSDYRYTPSPTVAATGSTAASSKNTSEIEEGMALLNTHVEYGHVVQKLLDSGEPTDLTKAYNALAWHWAVCDNPAHRDAEKAARYAYKAYERETQNRCHIRNTLAAINACRESFADAVAMQEAALRDFHNEGPLDDEELKRRFRERLQLYKEQKTYTEAFK